MDGHPLARLLVVLIFLGLMAIPVIGLTREKPLRQAAAPAKTAVAAEETLDLVVTLSQPGQVEIRRANQIMAISETNVASLEKKITLPVSKSELTVKFKWDDGNGSHAGRVVISQDGEALSDQTFWGQAEAQDVLTVTVPQL